MDLTVQQIAYEVLHGEYSLESYEEYFPIVATWVRDAVSQIGLMVETNTFCEGLTIPSNGHVEYPEGLVKIVSLALVTNDNQIQVPSFATGLGKMIYDIGAESITGNPHTYNHYSDVSFPISSYRNRAELGTDGVKFFFTMGNPLDYKCLLVAFTGLKRNDDGDLMVPFLMISAVKAYISWKYMTRQSNSGRLDVIPRTMLRDLQQDFHQFARDARGKIAMPTVEEMKTASFYRYMNFVNGPTVR